MANLYGSFKNKQKLGGYLAPRVTYGGDLTGRPPTKPTQAYGVTQGLTSIEKKSQPEHWSMGLAKSIAAAPVDVIDTVNAIFPGMKRGQVNDAVYNSLGMPGFAEWVRDNHGGVEVASGLLGAVVTGVAAEIAVGKVLTSGWVAASTLGRATAPVINMVSRAKYAAARESLAAAEKGTALKVWEGANRSYMLAKGLQGLGKAAVSEVAIVAALHNNSFIWGEDTQTNLILTGLGLGLGTGIGVITGRSLIQRWANREIMREAFARAADPGYFERIMGTAPTGPVQAKNLSSLRGPVRSGEFTALMLDATRDDATGGARQVGNRNAIQTGKQRTALQVLQTMTHKGVAYVPESKFDIKATGAGEHIIEASRRDPLILLGSVEIGMAPKGMAAREILENRIYQINLADSDPLATQAEIKLAQMQKTETPVFIIDRGLATADEVDSLSQYVPPQIKSNAAGTGELTWVAPYSGQKMVIREDGRLVKGDWMNMNPADQQGVIDAMNQLLVNADKKKLTVPAKPTFMELDFAVRFEERGGVVDYTTGAKIRDAEDAMIQSLRMKAKIVEGLKLEGKSLDFTERMKLNLPRPTRLESATDPTGAGMFNILKAAMQEGISTSDLRGLRVKAMRQVDIGTDATLDSRLDGDLFNFNRAMHGKKGEWMPVLMVTYKDPADVKWSRFDLSEMVAEQKALSLQILLGKPDSNFTSRVTKAIADSPNYRQAVAVSGLDDVQIPGTSNPLTSAASQFTTQAHRFRNNPVLQAAQALRRVTNRMTEIYLDDVLGRLSPLVDQLSSVAGQRSRVLLNQYMTYSPGWDIQEVVPAMTGNGMAFKLAKTERNAARLQREVTDTDTLFGPNGVEVILDEVANAAREALEEEYGLLLKERNIVRMSRGLDPIPFKAFYTPPPSTRGKILGFTLDAQDRIVPNGTVVASTRQEFNEAKAAIEKGYKSGDGLRFVTQDEMADFADVWEQAQMNWWNPLDFIDPRTLAGKSGPQKGLLQSSTVNPRGLEDALEFIKGGYEATTNGIMRTMFDSQLKITRIRGNAAKVTQGAQKGVKDIWKTYEETLMGISATSDPRGLNIPVKAAEDLLDASFQTAWPQMHGTSMWIRDLANKMGMSKIRKSVTFNDLADQLGKHMPFKTAEDYAEYKYGLKAPWKSKELARHANRFGAGVVLRWLEMPHAVMNMAGIITSLPAVMTAKSVPGIGRVGNVTVPDVFRIMSKGFARQFQKDSADFQFMVKNGDSTQDVAELHHHMAMLDGKGPAMRLLTGDPKYAYWDELKGQARIRAMLRFKGIEGMASIMTDTSENMSRRWAHFVGLELADLHGITGMEGRHNFARQIANDTIANYDPLNRPEIFQSAFGSMYGLFLSYAQNYYERMFRWVEGGDFKAVGRSLSLQASMFGFTGVPGFRQLEAIIGGEEDGEGVLDNTYKRFGPAVASVLAQGSFNQFSTILGLPAVSFHTRGDVNFRHPALDFAGGTPILPVGIEVLKDIITGTTEAVASLVDPKIPNSARYAAEIMARNMPSRMIRGAISVMALGGKEADAFGNLMSETKGAAEVGIRLLGLRSGRQQAEIEAYFMNQKSLAIDAARMEPVRAATRALVRSGNMDDLHIVFQKYVDAGGKPWNYANWIQGIVAEAGNTRGQNQLQRALRGKGQEVLANRIMMMTAPY